MSKLNDIPTTRVEFDVEVERVHLIIALNLWPVACWAISASRFHVGPDMTSRPERQIGDVIVPAYEYVNRGLRQWLVLFGPLQLQLAITQREAAAEAEVMIEDAMQEIKP